MTSYAYLIAPPGAGSTLQGIFGALFEGIGSWKVTIEKSDQKSQSIFSVFRNCCRESIRRFHFPKLWWSSHVSLFWHIHHDFRDRLFIRSLLYWSQEQANA